MEQEKNIRASVLTNEPELYFTVDVFKERYDLHPTVLPIFSDTIPLG